MIQGQATAEGTKRYRERFSSRVAEGHFREWDGLWLSSVGLGSYLGEPDEACDEGYEEAVLEALAAGCNVIDTAINYRHQRSERAIGRALHRAFQEGIAARDEVFVSTKGGFLPFDGQLPEDPAGYLREAYLESGLIGPGEIAAGCHAMGPSFLGDQLARSRENLGLETIDLYYVHNPETQLGEISRERLACRLEAAFERLRQAARDSWIGRFGVATWNALRTPPGGTEHLDLEELEAIAARAGSRASVAAVQLPFNLAMPEALVRPTQALQDVVVPLTVAARRCGAAVFVSASILQGRLSRSLPREIHDAFPGLATDAQRALQFARSAPGVTTALVGMARLEHVRENLALAEIPPAPVSVYRQLFGS